MISTTTTTTMEDCANHIYYLKLKADLLRLIHLQRNGKSAEERRELSRQIADIKSQLKELE